MPSVVVNGFRGCLDETGEVLVGPNDDRLWRALTGVRVEFSRAIRRAS
jgi:hypothetical protein